MIRRVLAVGHDASRTGAPATLLNVLRWVHLHRGVQVATVLLRAGPLVPDFAAVGPVEVQPAALDLAARAAAVTGTGRGPTSRAEGAWRRRALRSAPDADLVLVSSAAALPALDHLPPGSPPIVVHLHEGRAVLDTLGGGAGLGRHLARAALVLVPTMEIAALCTRPPAEGGFGLPPDRVRRHPEPTAPPDPHPRPRRDEHRALVVGCGTVGWRKGTDLFVALADAVGPTVGARQVHWHWIGGDGGDGTAADVADEITLRGLAGRVHLDGEVADAPARLAASDLLVVTSREDPYPLVAVEAALAGTPVAGFRPGTTLLAEAGLDRRRIDDLDVPALADQVVDLLLRPDRGRLLAGELARAAAAAATPLAVPVLWSDVEDAVSGAAAPARGGP